MSVGRIYLLVYNGLNSIGWLYVLLILLNGFYTQGLSSFQNVWTELGDTIWRLQQLVLLDVIHALFGLWGDHPTIPLYKRIWCKVGHRSENFVTIYLVSDRMAMNWTWGPLVFCWALADVFRFPYYAMSTMGLHYYWLSWVRYSIFIIQWPLLICAELAFVAAAFPILLILPGGPLVSYAWIAALAQARNLLEFPMGFLALWTARAEKLRHRT